MSNGLFTVKLNFGANVFSGEARWLEIAVRTNGAVIFTPLNPRQQLTPTPHALYAPKAGAAASVTGNVPASQLSGTISAENIGDGSITTTMLAAGAVGANQLAQGAVTTSALANGAVTAEKFAIVSDLFVLTIPNPTPATGDYFGNSLAAVGTDRVLIGAYFDDTSASDAGAAYLFSGNGALLTTFTSPASASDDRFGISVAAVGTDRVLIGATGANGTGAAYLFNANSALLTTFTNPTPAAGDLFGISVAAMGTDRVLIGASSDDTGAGGAGAAYLFSTNGALLTTFTNPTPDAVDNFGYSVAVVGSDRVLIGAYRNGTEAYLFSTEGALLTTFTNPTLERDDRFGHSVAAVGTDRVLIGAHWADAGATNAGLAYLFSTDGALLTTFSNRTPTASAQFGYSVAAVGTDRVLIGAIGDDTGATDAGAAYLFSTSGLLLTTVTNPTPASRDSFGNSVIALGTDRILIAAYSDATGASDAGAAYLFTLDGYTPGLVAEGVRAGSITSASLADGAVTSEKIGGVILASQIPDLDASKITSGVLADAQHPPSLARTNQVWLLGGNRGTTPGNHFIGTTDNQPLEIRVNNLRALRLEDNGDSNDPDTTPDGAPNVIGGSLGNVVGVGAVGATISGGGALNNGGYLRNNVVSADYGTVGGGLANQVLADSWAATISGGYMNDIAAHSLAATIAGGYVNHIATNCDSSAIGGGRYNEIADNSGFATIAGGYLNHIATNSHGNAIGGGTWNRIGMASIHSTIGGGYRNNIGYDSESAAIAGGSENDLGNRSEFSAIGGGRDNNIADASKYATIAGGEVNEIATFCDASTISGGIGNDIGTHSPYSTIGGGRDNNIARASETATIAGGSRNDIGVSSDGSAIGGGYENNIGSNLWYSTIGGGRSNTIVGSYATIPGGHLNTATSYAFAAGYRAKALHKGAFVWGDSAQDSDFTSTDDCQFLIRASGGVGIGLNAPEQALHVNGNVQFDKTGTTPGRLILNTVSRNDPQRFGIQFANNVVAPFIGDDTQPIAFGFMSGWSDRRTNDAVLRVHGKTSGSWGKCIELKHDGTNGMVSTDAGHLLLAPAGNVGIGNSNPNSKLVVVNARCDGNNWINASDRSLKENFSPVDVQQVLEKLAALPINRWNYRQTDHSPHLGPVAQDFSAAFGLGADDTSISTVDADGVALAAIQGLNQKLEDRSQKLEAENERLKQEVAELKALVKKLAEKLNGGGQ